MSNAYFLSTIMSFEHFYPIESGPRIIRSPILLGHVPPPLFGSYTGTLIQCFHASGFLTGLTGKNGNTRMNNVPMEVRQDQEIS